MSRIQEFYADRNIFITGGTGFLGKILIEKLLRSCPDIRKIYLLIRGKKGKSPRERIDALLADVVFDVLRENYPDFSQKIVGVTGDIAENGLGLNTTDQARLIDEVSVIFHLAATVRFNEELEKAVAINVNSVKCIVEIAKACKNLEVAIHVSTAYSHCPRKSIDEELYPPPLSYEGVNELIEDVRKKKWSKDELQSFTEGVLGEWPNTYGFTKAIAEGVIAEFAKDLPFAVFRPSIVMNTYKEPIAGWVAGLIGLPGILLAAGLGILHVLPADATIKFDVVPVDYVCNALIASAWKTAITGRRQHHKIPVYNYVSGSENPISFGRFSDTTWLFGSFFPSITAVYYSFVILVKSRWLFVILDFFLHLLPALIIDSIARLFGKQLELYKTANKIGNALRAVAYFLIREWNFENKRTQNLWKQMGPMERQTFPFNMQDLDWDEYLSKIVKGLRKYIIHESDENLKQARQRRVYLYIIHTIVRLAFGIFVLWITWKLFHGYGL